MNQIAFIWTVVVVFEVQYQFVSSQNFDVSGLSSFFDRPIGNGGQTPASTTNIRFDDDPLRFPFFGTPNPPSVTQAPVPQEIPVCHQQSCDQDYQARNIPYSQALEIVNTRDYEEETFASAEGIVRRRKRKKRSDPIGIKIEITRFKNRSLIDPVYPEHNGWIPIELEQQSTKPWRPLLNERQSPQAEAVSSSYLVLPVVGRAPPDQPQPGEPGGGRAPIAVNPQAALALALVPPAHFPVSLMPPFTDPGSFPAVCVIFSESDFDSIQGFLASSGAKRRSKRFISTVKFRRMYQQYSKNIRKFFTNKRRPRTMASYNKNNLIHQSSLQRPDLKSEHPSFRQLPDPNPRPIYFPHVKSKRIIAPRLFGVRCRARFVDRPCALGTTCDDRGATIMTSPINPSQPRADTYSSSSSVSYNIPYPHQFNNPSYLRGFTAGANQTYRRHDNGVDRQTGERFFTSAPPECRSERNEQCLK
ncbi:uncharacterized protein LOC131887166 [Tigriopus californicus]|uniref:uncharacterized protein LOC131887166 n=1 Tax=Tigriopus californicus TaxID=6832 RepID=UPI0027DAAD25|nr:uncharacterized protein LOC131887166 [Tigriopus californicus]